MIMVTLCGDDEIMMNGSEDSKATYQVKAGCFFRSHLKEVSMRLACLKILNKKVVEKFHLSVLL